MVGGVSVQGRYTEIGTVFRCRYRVGIPRFLYRGRTEGGIIFLRGSVYRHCTEVGTVFLGSVQGRYTEGRAKSLTTIPTIDHAHSKYFIAVIFGSRLNI
jgi:hypothetical protein